MKRGGPLKRKTRLRRKAWMRRSNHERRAALKAEQFGPCAVMARTLPCCVRTCDEPPPSEAAHVRSRGAGGRDRANVAPLCRDHHREQHTIGIVSFEAEHDLDLEAVARAVAQLVDDEEKRP
jgi:hypothetical protein